MVLRVLCAIFSVFIQVGRMDVLLSFDFTGWLHDEKRNLQVSSTIALRSLLQFVDVVGRCERIAALLHI